MTIPRCTRQSSLIVPESLTSFTNTLMEIGHGHLLGRVCFESMTTLGVECYFKEIVYLSTEPNKSTEHRETQGGSVHCTVVAVQVSRLLSTIWNFGNFDHSNWVICNCFYRSQLYRNLSLLKLVSKPGSLLLEDRRRETNGEGRNQTSALLSMKLSACRN